MNQHVSPAGVPALSFNGVEIRDRNEMLSLTDMWKAQGGDASKRPVEWLRSEQAQRFISFMAEDLGMGEVGKSHFGLVTMKKGGSEGGATFAHWQIGLAYAKYLSPEFHMWCNTVVRERMEGTRSMAELPAEVLEEIRRTDGISRMLAHKVTEQGKDIATLVQTVTALTALVQPNVPGVVIRHGKTAGAILRAAGFTNSPTRLALWFGNRLEAAGCRVEGRIDTGTGHSRLFDPDKAEEYLKNGGAAAVEKKIAERRGQGALALSGRAIQQHLPPDLSEGQGAVFLNGKLVFFDIRQTQIEDGGMGVIITSAGDVMVDACEKTLSSHIALGARGVMSSEQMEVLPGNPNPRPVRHGSVLLGRVTEIRTIRPRPVLVASNEATTH